MRGLLLLLVMVVGVIFCVMNPDQLGSIADWAMAKFHR